MKISRVWAMPSHETFKIKPIAHFVKQHLVEAKVSIDPFARNSSLTTYTNDLNPDTTARYHLKAMDFLLHMEATEVRPDLVIFDPPYSLRQVKECYDKYGDGFSQRDSQNAIRWRDEKAVINRLLSKNGIVLSFGWNTVGMGKKRGYELEEVLVVCHGAAHNDTLCIAERKLQTEKRLY